MAVAMIEAQAADPAYAAAVEARTGGRLAEALAMFDKLSRERPADADVWLNLGLTDLALHRYEEADRAFEAALRLAPTYRDARVGYARSALFRGRPALARDRLAPLAEDGEVATLRTQIAAAIAERPAAWRFDIAHARSELSDGLGHWTATTVAVGRRSGDTSLSASAERTTRFGRTDVYVEALGARTFGSGMDAWLAVGGAPDADYRPKASVRGGGSKAIGAAGDWTVRLGADGGWARYAVGDVETVQPNVSAAWKDRFTLSGRVFLTLDERDDFRRGYAVRGEWRVMETLRLYAGWADAPESSEGRTVTVRAASAGAAIDLTPRLTIQASFAHEKRDAYDRDELALALTTRF